MIKMLKKKRTMLISTVENFGRFMPQLIYR